MSRREELRQYVDKSMFPLIDEMLFIEDQLTYLKDLPFLIVHPTDPSKQKSTPAAKQYKELLQQYTNIVKILTRSSEDDNEEESPLRKWLNEHSR